jgi:hypothetical protein
MTPQRLLNTGIVPALAELEALGIPDSVDARRILLAIALQETSLQHRRQVVAGGAENGPAASFWQFEQGGGCQGVLTHPAVSDKMNKICFAFNVLPTKSNLWEAMRYNDIVAAAAARCLIYTLPKKLPTTEADGWAQYVAAWRPGKPHPESWAMHWRNATLSVGLK